jgi:mycothiol synthase
MTRPNVRAISFRSAQLTDAERVHGLLLERELAEMGAVDSTLQDLRDQWLRSEFDLSADTRVAETASGRIVGFAVTDRPGTMVVVAPDHLGLGIGTRLRRWAEHRDHERGRARHRQWIGATNEPARALLIAAGYRSERSYWRLARRLDDVDATIAPPAGVSLRGVDVERDATVLHALHETSFIANADYQPYTLAAFHEAHLQAHDFDPGLSCIAECAGDPIGFLLAWRWQEGNIGFVDLLGTHPDHRGRGVASAMLQIAFARFAAAGLHEAQLGVASDNPKALRLYERCRMTQRFRHDIYERSGAPIVPLER